MAQPIGTVKVIVVPCAPHDMRSVQLSELQMNGTGHNQSGDTFKPHYAQQAAKDRYNAQRRLNIRTDIIELSIKTQIAAPLKQ